MKLTFKDLKQQKFTIDAEPTETIGAVKAKISAEKGWEPAQQKLIYSGKILQDENTIESYKIEEKGFIVCMTSKMDSPRQPPSPRPSHPRLRNPHRLPPLQQHRLPRPRQSPRTHQLTPSHAPSSNANYNDPNALAMGEQRAAAITNMEAMGFPRDQIDRAMRAAFFNPDRAVEYLLNGIPASAEQEQRQAAAPQAQQPAQGGNTGSQAAAPAGGQGSEEPVNLFEAAAQAGQGGRGGGAGGNRGAGAGDLAAALGGGQGGGAGGAQLDFLRNNPQFQQLRQVVQQQPAMLEPILQQVAAGNPQLAQIITQNPDQFMQLLAEDGDDVELPPGTQQISVTAEEQEAIERLCRLGFDRQMAIQAYFACDKNEELAANFLFDQPDEPDEAA
ncbi:UV excision repair protein Rad23 [Teratosphaeria destructans]|uniref:UV excision repair protein RAD23 n=1 Tax=Teratosphaeria destructans TaxID=418781 RepID=A0A9W7SYV3_9PEZI|nr:UV excision repair protein Rad23 [Teratosphaeria destructans]